METVESGWNILVGADGEKIKRAFHDLRGGSRVPRESPDFYGNGEAGKRILNSLLARAESGAIKERTCTSLI